MSSRLTPVVVVADAAIERGSRIGASGTDPTGSGVPPTEVKLRDRLQRFLQAYWLRPENAFWMTLRSEVLRPCPRAHPSIDVSCGDGVFSFLHGGGVFDPDFDVFQSVAGLDGVRAEHADMFDHISEDFQPDITAPPVDPFDVGTDAKPSMLAKAERLSCYGRLVEHDNNNPLPFEDHSFQTVYCNAAYWVENIDGFLSELRRITRPGGSIILHVKLDSMRRFTLDAHRSRLGDRFLDVIGRGRMETWPSLADRSTWESRFLAAALRVHSATAFVTRTHAHVWDIGLRPIAPLLVRMTQSLAPATRSSIKREWVDLFCNLLEPLCHFSFDLFGAEEEPAEIQYVLTPG